MASSCQALVVTGAAVALYCLAVSFGPDLLFGPATKAVALRTIAQVQFSAPSQGSSVRLGREKSSFVRADSVRVMPE